MSEAKFTKTANFLFPLLQVPKSFFQCDVLDRWGRLQFSSRFINAYLVDETIDKYNDKDYIFVVLRNYQDVNFDKFYSTLQAFPNYVDDYDYNECCVAVFSIPKETKPDFDLIKNGQYSKVSELAKKLIMSNNFFSGKIYVIPLILSKAKVLKDNWEERLSSEGDPVDLGDMEVWPIINIEQEVLTKKVLATMVTRKYLEPVGEV